MKPRIFISSTFYDLKYIREDLANFVRSYGYEPVLFEDGDIGYVPGKNLDNSCYESMKNSDMVILIIGGEYGSAASGEEKDGFKEYMSITRKEFRTAIEAGIPVFVMIDKKVIAEYGVYEANYNLIENDNHKVAFPTTKSINVFRFIKEIKGIVTLPIQEFEKASDIKGFISKQWADMFKNYLSMLRNEKEDKKIENSVNEMKALIQKMNIMLDSVGKNVLTDEYDDVVNRQEVLAFCDVLAEAFDWRDNPEITTNELRKKWITQLLDNLIELKENNLLNNNVIFGDNSERFDEFLNILEKNKVGITRGISNVNRLHDKMDILSDERSKRAIIETMVQDEHYFKLCSA